ncbi:MAG TPA: hypothetical protein VGJ25_09280 [Gaiellaceae bacterium]
MASSASGTAWSGGDFEEPALERDALGLQAVDVEAGLDEPAVDRRGGRVAVAADPEPAADGLGAVAGEERLRPQVVARGDEHGRRLAGELVDRALDHDAALVDDRDRVAGLLDLVEQVGGEDDRAPFLDEPADHEAELLHAGRVQPVHRLVEDQQLRIAEQRPGDAQALAHTERVRLDLLVGAPGEADAVEGTCDALVRLRLAGGRDDVEVLAAREVVVEARFLDDRADAGQCFRPAGGHRVTEDADFAGGDRGEAEQHADERGLARAVRAQVAEGRAGGDAEVDTVDRNASAEALRQALGLDDVCGVGVHGTHAAHAEPLPHRAQGRFSGRAKGGSDRESHPKDGGYERRRRGEAPHDPNPLEVQVIVRTAHSFGRDTPVRAYWLTCCQGFDVRTDGRLIGIVEEILCADPISGADALVVRGRGMRRHEQTLPVERVVAVVPAERELLVAAAVRTPVVLPWLARLARGAGSGAARASARSGSAAVRWAVRSAPVVRRIARVAAVLAVRLLVWSARAVAWALRTGRARASVVRRSLARLVAARSAPR